MICRECCQPLTEDEVEYYEDRCEHCERERSERIGAWMAGREDAELDALYDRERPPCIEPIEPMHYANPIKKTARARAGR